MKNSINIYWSNVPTVDQYSNILGVYSRNLLTYSPISVLSLLRQKYKDDAGVNPYFRCPAAQDELKNYFAIRADADLSFKFNKENGIEIKSPTRFDPNFAFIVRSKKNQFCSLNSSYIFFSEEDVEITQFPAFFEDNSFVKNTQLTVGKFNVSKWFRPFDCTFFLKSKENEIINIKRGDILFYIKVNTNKKVKFKEFIYTQKHHIFVNSCTVVKEFQYNTPLNILYSLFNNKNLSKRVLKEIKTNLVI